MVNKTELTQLHRCSLFSSFWLLNSWLFESGKGLGHVCYWKNSLRWKIIDPVKMLITRFSHDLLMVNLCPHDNYFCYISWVVIIILLSFVQMVDWVSLIIDSHATQFIMSTNTRQLILDIHRTTGHKVCLQTQWWNEHHLFSVMMLSKAMFLIVYIITVQTLKCVSFN